MRFLHVTVAIDFQENVLHPCRRPAFERGLDEWTQHVPQFRPTCTNRISQAQCGMFGAEKGAEGSL